MRLPSLKFAAVMVTACAIAGFASSHARAEFVAGFTGYSQMSDNINDKGFVSFAVYHNTSGGDWKAAMEAELGQAPGSINRQSFVIGGGGAIDTTAKYVYMYEVVNVGPANIDALKVRFPERFTSSGLFLQQVFQTTGGNYVLGTSAGAEGVPFVTHLGTTQNGDLGTGPVGGDDIPYTGKPNANDGVVTGIKSNPKPTKLVWDSSQSDLDQGGDQTLNPYGPNVTTQWLGQTGGPGQWSPVKAGNAGSIVFLTSDLPPEYSKGIIKDGEGSDGDVPVPAPEPGSLVLAGMGLAGLLGSYVRRRKLSKGSAAA